MKSIVSYPSRGPWGNAAWRGNCSGHLYRDLFEQLRPKLFVDPMVGSGTSTEVAQSMGIEAIGLDLHSGFNALRDSIYQAIGNRHADLIVSHPPYSAMIRYSGNVWGSSAHPDDLSHCESDDEFNEKMQRVLMNQRCATAPEGIYGTIIGDWRRGDRYSCYMAEIVARMPRDELASVIIKAQHNCMSDKKTYSRLSMPMVIHEYCVLFRKRAKPMLVVVNTLVNQAAQRVIGTWKAVVLSIMQAAGKPLELEKIYACVASGAEEKVAGNQFWREKVRQVLNSSPEFKSYERGVWGMA